jgi:endonuclease III
MAVLERTVPDAASTPAVDLGLTLSCYRHGRNDPTTWIDRVGRGPASAGRFVRATTTPDGPATLLLRWGPGATLDAEAWGPGGEWILARVPAMVGDHDGGAPDCGVDTHPVVARCLHEDRHRRIGASSTLYHELLPTIIEQRVTSIEAKSQWVRLCGELSEPAPGPFARLLLPPCPNVLRRRPAWWFHPLGLEAKRAKTLVEVARHADKMWAWAGSTPAEAGRKLRLIPGIGVWTVGCVLAPALGDADAVPVGDYHVKNIIAWNLAGEARATDERMLQLLEPYTGQRGRVVGAITAHGAGAPKFGPKQRILPMRRW